MKNVDLKKKIIKQTFPARMARLLKIPEKNLYKILRPSDVFACRLNRLRNVSKTKVISSAEKQGIVLEPIDWYPDAFLVRSSKYDLLNTDLVKGGVLYVQNASSYLPVLALEPKPEEIIFDACAAPAGKSSMIASLTGGDAKLWLNDGIKSRLEKIKQVQKLLGFKYEKLTCFPAQSIDKEINQQFDKILLDIQCSGEGMIDISKPFTMRFWNISRIKKYMHMQTKALNACFRLLKPGGVLVYSTCTFAPEENEAPISNLLKNNPDAVIQPLILNLKNARKGEKYWDDLRFNTSLSGALRILPSDGMEGFFVCRIRKKPTEDDCEPIDLKQIGKKYSEMAELQVK